MFKNSKLSIIFSRLFEKKSNLKNINRSIFSRHIGRTFCEANKNENNKLRKFSIKNMKQQLKEYGSLGLTVYLCLYVPTLATFYYLFKSKTLDPASLVNFLYRNGAESFIDIQSMKSLINSEGATLAFALICNRLSLIIRLPLTLYLTYLIKKFFRK